MIENIIAYIEGANFEKSLTTLTKLCVILASGVALNIDHSMAEIKIDVAKVTENVNFDHQAIVRVEDTVNNILINASQLQPQNYHKGRIK